MNQKNNLVIVTSVHCYSIACPTTWEGTTSDDRAIYARYRWGQLSIRLGNPGDKDEMAGCYGSEILDVSYGGPHSGSMEFETLQALTKGIIVWPSQTE